MDHAAELRRVATEIQDEGLLGWGNSCHDAADYIDRLRGLIQAHNDGCAEACGVGDQEGVRCKYRPYFPRHCPDCPRDWMIDTGAADQPGAVLPCPDGVWHECARAVCQSRMSCMDATLKAAEGHFRDRSGVLDAWLKAPTPCATEVEPADQPPAFDFQAATGQPCDQPGAVQSLSCEIRDGAIYIAIGSETVRLATNESPALYDGTRQTVVVSDSARWLKSVWHRLTEEDEDGSTPVSRMFDAAIERAVDQGDEGVDERAADNSPASQEPGA